MEKGWKKVVDALPQAKISSDVSLDPTGSN